MDFPTGSRSLHSVRLMKTIIAGFNLVRPVSRLVQKIVHELDKYFIYIYLQEKDLI